MMWTIFLAGVLAGLSPWPRVAGAGAVAVVVVVLWRLAEGLGHA